MDQPTKPFETQVGGHMNIMSSHDDSIILKPCATTEREFYEQSSHYPELMPFLAEFMGTLSSSPATQMAPETDVVVKQATTELNATVPTKEPENLLLPYTKPSVLDLKIGTQLYDHLATPEKQQRMALKAKETTSFELGIRVTGMKVFDHSKGEYEVYDREYGVGLTNATIFEAFDRFIPARLPVKIRLTLLDDFIDSLGEFISVLETLPVRMAASSLLFVYEGDVPSLEDKITAYQQFIDHADEESKSTEGSHDNSSEGDSIPVPPTNLKLIDFAHSYFINSGPSSKRSLPAGTQGPDEGCLLGARTTLKFLNQLRTTLEASE